jgi:protein-tyrosine-phosphatase
MHWNSARSIMAEAILNKFGAGKFRAYSAGSQPKGRVNPHTVQLLQSLGYYTSNFRSKPWTEFATPGAPPLDFVFTVCDSDAGETCPVCPGQTMTRTVGAHSRSSYTPAARQLHRRTYMRDSPRWQRASPFFFNVLSPALSAWHRPIALFSLSFSLSVSLGV